MNESVIYRSVGARQQIFESAVLDPYHGFVASFVDRWRSASRRRSNSEMVGTFVYQGYDLLAERRELISSLVGASTLTDEHDQLPARVQLNAELDALAAQTAADGEGRGPRRGQPDPRGPMRGRHGHVTGAPRRLVTTRRRQPAKPQELLSEVRHFVLGGLERNLRQT